MNIFIGNTATSLTYNYHQNDKGNYESDLANKLFGARRLSGLSVSQTADFLGFAHTAVPGIYSHKKWVVWSLSFQRARVAMRQIKNQDKYIVK